MSTTQSFLVHAIARASVLGILCLVPTGGNAQTEPSDTIGLTIRICEGTDSLRFWFNEKARSRWDGCKRPLADIPVYLITDTDRRFEATTDATGTATLPEITIPRGEKFRLAMACTSHRCLSLHALFVGAFIKPGSNTVFVETVPTSAEQGRPGSTGAETGRTPQGRS